MSASTEGDENTNRILELLSYAAAQHVAMKPEVIDLSIPEPTLKIASRIPFHEVAGDLVSALLILLVGVFKIGKLDKPKLRAIREARERIETAIRTMPPAADAEPICARIVELAGQYATKFGAGVGPDVPVERYESKATIRGEGAAPEGSDQ